MLLRSSIARSICYSRHSHLTCAHAVRKASEGSGQSVQSSQPSSAGQSHNAPYSEAIAWLVDEIGHVGCAYMLQGAAAAHLHGAQLPPSLLSSIQVEVQWDQLDTLRARWHNMSPSHVVKEANQRRFTVSRLGVQLQVAATLNTVLALAPERLEVAAPWAPAAGVWCQALTALRDQLQQDLGRAAAVHNHLQPAPPQSPWDADEQQLLDIVQQRLIQQQEELSATNSAAWAVGDTFDAWVARWGPPAEAAAKLVEDPRLRLGPLAQHLPPTLRGLYAINLLGSHGSKAVALALLGARVMVVDVSPGNAAYAAQLAAAAAVELEYVVADVLNMPGHLIKGNADLVLLELGVLHYFVDLQPLTDLIYQLLAPGGMLLLREFHPVSTKLLTSKGKKHKVSGNYFNMGFTTTSVAYSKHSQDLQQDQPAAVRLRQWSLGEVVTAVSRSGLCIQRLVEEPGNQMNDAGIPKLFTLVARKPGSKQGYYV